MRGGRGGCGKDVQADRGRGWLFQILCSSFDTLPPLGTASTVCMQRGPTQRWGHRSPGKHTTGCQLYSFPGLPYKAPRAGWSKQHRRFLSFLEARHAGRCPPKALGGTIPSPIIISGWQQSSASPALSSITPSLSHNHMISSSAHVQMSAQITLSL